MNVIFLVAGIMTISAAVGATLLSALKKRRAQLFILSEFLNELAVMIRFQAQRLAPLIESLCYKDNFKDCDFIRKLSCSTAKEVDICSAWVNAAKEAAFISDECRSALISVGNSIGSTDVDGQLAVIGVHKTEIDRQLTEADKEYHRKGRLIASVCPLIGLGLTVMVL